MTRRACSSPTPPPISKVDGSLLVVSGGAAADPDTQQRAAYRFRLGRWWFAR